MWSSVLDRRTFVMLGAWAAGGCASRRIAAPSARCAEPTPEDLVGPFLPLRYRGDADLTRVEGRRERAQGEQIIIRGRVTDDRCQPLAAARLEVWQANTFGRYADDRDRSTRPLDPGFQGSALLVADGGGRFALRSVKPGSYETPGGSTMRTPHVHFRVSGPGCHDDIVQMYFAGEPLNATDENLALLSQAERRRVIIRPGGREDGAAIHLFDVVLRRVDAGAAPGLERWAGRYLLDSPRGQVPITLVVADGKLYSESPPLPRVELRPLGPTRFRLKAYNLEVELDPDGFTVIDGATRTRARRQPAR
jgi:protocatechuate 3,4-dioxygenase, beta subunit